MCPLAGTSRQVKGNINVTMNATQAAVAYTLKGMLDPDIPNNQGVLDVCETTAPPGCLLNCVSPAPVAARANTSQRIVDVVIGALADALPEAAVGAANGANTTAVFSGIDPATGRGYLYLETLVMSGLEIVGIHILVLFRVAVARQQPPAVAPPVGPVKTVRNGIARPQIGVIGLNNDVLFSRDPDGDVEADP